MGDAFIGSGGFVIVTSKGQIVRNVRVDDETLHKVAEALGIPFTQQVQFISDTASIHIYRGISSAPGASQSPDASQSPGASQSSGGSPPDEGTR